MAKVQAKKYQRTLGQGCEFHPLELWRGITDKELRDSGSLHLIVDRSDYKGIAEEIYLLKNQRPSLGGVDYSEISPRLEKYYNHWRLEGILDYSIGREGMATPFGIKFKLICNLALTGRLVLLGPGAPRKHIGKAIKSAASRNTSESSPASSGETLVTVPVRTYLEVDAMSKTAFNVRADMVSPTSATSPRWP